MTAVNIKFYHMFRGAVMYLALVIFNKLDPVHRREKFLVTAYVIKKRIRDTKGHWLCHGKVTMPPMGHVEGRRSNTMLEGPWLNSSQSGGSLLLCLSFLVFLHFNLVLCWCHIATFFLFNSPSQFHMPLSSFMRNSFSELAYNRLPISMPPFWHVKCLLSIHRHSVLQSLLFAVSCSFSMPSLILIYMELTFPFHKMLP